tara:strand:+ start:973 stop:1629 length:657 start_codon:yes stop_codon:yes gene_type:complete
MRWGLTADEGEKKVLEFLNGIGNNASVLFVGAGISIDFGNIIRQIRCENPKCEITFTDKHESIESIGEKFVEEGVEFVQMDILQTLSEPLFWDCVVAFGLFSPVVLWGEKAEIALENIIKVTKEKGLITISTHEKNALIFEKMLEDNNHLITYEKMTRYASHVAGRHEFIKGWKGLCPMTGYYFPGYEQYDRGIDAYKAYLEKEGDRRTNFYLTKNLD